MSSYFDEKVSVIRQVENTSDGEFLKRVREIELIITREVSLCTGMRFFPDDLREKIQTCIVKYQARTGSRGESHTLIQRRSVLIDELHSLFHEVATRRIDTPFGLLTDNPKGNTMRRDAWAIETFKV